MSLQDALTLFGVMVVLAAVPSTSVLVVTTDSLAHGFRRGVLTALGVVAGDIIHVFLAAYGLLFVASLALPFYALLALLCSIYLLVLGTGFLRHSRHPSGLDKQHRSGFLGGLLITLADHKALLFYFGLLPAFVDLEQLAAGDMLILVLIILLGVGGVKILYAYLAGRLSIDPDSRFATLVYRVAGVVLIATGLLVAVTALRDLFRYIGL